MLGNTAEVGNISHKQIHSMRLQSFQLYSEFRAENVRDASVKDPVSNFGDGVISYEQD